MHRAIEPGILYFGTPVVLLGTVNEDGSHNLAPMSSAFWLGWRCVLGLGSASKTSQNMMRTRECVLNLPSVDAVGAVNRLALTTGMDPIPEGKIRRGYRFEKNKFRIAGLTPVQAETVSAPRVQECQVQLESVVEAAHGIAEEDPRQRGRILLFEVRIQRVHAEECILMTGHSNRIDPDKWRPLIMSFQKFYGLQAEQVHDSTLAQVPEALYRTADVERARMHQ